MATTKEMAASLCPSRRGPVARFNTFEEPEEQLKAQLANSYRTQQALRARGVWHPKPIRCLELADGIQTTQSEEQLLDVLSHPPRSDSTNSSRDAEPYNLDRTFSFNSLSTLQRGVEASRLSQYRDSPVSACVPTERASLEVEREKEEPFPQITVFTLKQMRREQKLQKRSLKKQEKEQKKADKAQIQLRIHSEAAAQAAAKSKSWLVHVAKQETVPQRAASDPTFKASKEAAVQLVKKLTNARSITKLTRRPRTAPAPVPHIDDFDTKEELRQHINAASSTPEADIAELPGALPPYTPFQDSSANANNAPLTAAEAPVTSSPIFHSNSVSKFEYADGETPKMMRCDLCQFGIKVEEPYFQCSICNHGDRILCSACDAAGNSCRHELTERVRRVLRYDDGTRQSSKRQSSAERHAVFHDPARKRSPRRRLGQNDSAMIPSHRSSTQDVDEKKRLYETRDLEIRRREQDLNLREREANLRDREMLHRQERLQEAEAAAVRTLEIKQATDVQTTCMKQYAELASMLGAQFSNLRAEVEAAKRSSTASIPSDGRDIDLSEIDEGIHHHAGKRKASHTAKPTSSKSPKRPGQSPRIALPVEDLESEEDDDLARDGAPKDNKANAKSTLLPEKLFACHYCKYDPPRYSERNNVEKAYRGCSSGYWPDISRLKQHLYRVHWRGKHCKRCFSPFKTDAELDRHLQQPEPCQRGVCTFDEKFDDTKYNEIRRKRPGKSYEEVWFIIYDILFPDAPRPSTPYADSMEEQPTAENPTTNAQETWDALGHAFEARLDHHEKQDQQAWLRLPGAKAFLMEQLRASMADVIQRISPASSPAPPLPSAWSSYSTQAEQPRLRLSIQPTPASSITASPMPTSATSTKSTSSAQWLLPSHRRSFSRPLIPSFQHPESQVQHLNPDQGSTAVPDNSMTDVVFPMATVADPENDQYDDESNSWQEGDESRGFAITTDDDFDFDFNNGAACADADHASVSGTQYTELGLGPQVRLMSHHPSFTPVKISTLTNPEPGQAIIESVNGLKPNISNASTDSGYNSGSLKSRPLANEIPKSRHCKPTAFSTVRSEETPVPDHELNFDALMVPFQEFTGMGTDEHGNMGGRSLEEYLNGRYECGGG